MNLSIDFGYGWVKALLNTRSITFPHAIGTPDPVRYRTDSTTAHPLTIRLGGETHSYYLGNAAVLQSRHAWSRVEKDRDPWELRAILAFAVAQLSTNVETVIDTLISGLPVGWYTEDKASHAEALTGALEYQYKTDVWKKLEVKRTAVLPQPLGTWLHVAQTQPELKDPDFITGIIDVGHFTTDCVQISGGEGYLAPQSFSFPVGVKKLQDDLILAAQQAYSYELTPQQADKALRQNYLKVRGEQKPLLIDSSITALTSEITARINSLWQGARALDGVIVSGGGAHFLFNAIRALYPHAITVDEPELANVRGYQVFGEGIG